MSESKRLTRPPVVTILGHVDHGKTSLLDYIRKASVASKEAGGITQAIGAYQIIHNGHPLTFIDTPGHAAFSAMRARGGQAADVAVLVIAADDSVMPQTKESISHIKKARIPFVVAINKVDLPGVNPERVKTDLANNEVFVEGYGGNTPFVPISAKTGQGIEDLLEVILLLSELEELPNTEDERPAMALVIESSLHSQKGPLATLLVRNGTFFLNDELFSSTSPIGKVRSMSDYNGKQISSATPSTPFQVIGLSQVPSVGDLITNQPQELSTTVGQNSNSLEINPDLPNIILKTDVHGSLEAILNQLKDKVNVISSSVGFVTDTDVQNAVATCSEIVGFNSKMSSSVSKLAEVDKVKFTNFNIIYKLFDHLDELKEIKAKEIGPKMIEVGQAKVLKVFNFKGIIIYGCLCTSGKLKIGNQINNSIISSLKSGKEDVLEVKKDQEFGLALTPSATLQAGDIITALTEESK